MISKMLLRNAYDQRVLNLEPSPHGDGIVCRIGEYWFYFGGTTASEYNDPEEYIKKVPKEVIIDDIKWALAEFHDEFTNEYKYYEYYLKEHVKQ